MVKITGLVICEVLLYTVLRQYKPEVAILSEVVCGILIVFAVADELEGVLGTFPAFFAETGLNGSYISVLLKSLGIALITQFTADICRDAGENSAASKIEFAGRVMITASALPLIEGVVGLITGMAGGA